MSRNIVIFGASSAIAQETARHFANAGDRLLLVGRDGDKLQAVAQDLRVRGAVSVEAIIADLVELSGLESLVEQVVGLWPHLDIALVAHGVLGDQVRAQQDWQHAEMILRANFVSQAALLTPLANYFESQGHGSIAVISSVAGDRGRASNYVYGAAKAAMTAWVSGLRGRLARKGVHVLTVQPGFVATPMTAHLKAGLLVAQPKPVGLAIFKAIEAQKDVLYVPGFWRLIMFVVRHLPEVIFKRLKF